MSAPFRCAHPTPCSSESFHLGRVIREQDARIAELEAEKIALIEMEHDSRMAMQRKVDALRAKIGELNAMLADHIRVASDLQQELGAALDRIAELEAEKIALIEMEHDSRMAMQRKLDHALAEGAQLRRDEWPCDMCGPRQRVVQAARRVDRQVIEAGPFDHPCFTVEPHLIQALNIALRALDEQEKAK